MAKGNWKPEVIKPQTRCRLCGYVIKANAPRVYLNGITPAHKECADRKGKPYTETFTPADQTPKE